MLPSFLRPETVAYTSVELHRADGTVEQLIARKTDSAPPCACGVAPGRHVDGWDGNPLDCTEARRRAGLAPLAEAAPATQLYASILLDALHDHRASDAQILAERDAELEAEWRADREGDACGAACGFCGRCS